MDCAAEFARLARFPVPAWLAKLELGGQRLATDWSAVAFEIVAEAERAVLSARAE